VQTREVGIRYKKWTHRDSLGVTETGSTSFGGYDPLGNFASRAAPPPTGQPAPQPTGGYYGQPYLGAGSSFTNANNYSGGCILDGVPTNCNSVLAAVNSEMARVRTISSPGLVDLPGLGFVTVGGGEPKDRASKLLFLGHALDTQSSNPNCMLNFVRTKDGRTATEVARPYDRGHDGRHDISPISTGTYGGDVVALPALEGAQVIRFGTQEPEGHSKGLYLDIQLKNGMVLVLKDLNSLNSTVTRGLRPGKTGSGIKLSSGSQLGTIFSNVDPLSRTGLHVTLVRDRAAYDNFYVPARLPGRTHVEDRLPWTIDPLDPKLSPFNCPNLKRTVEGLPLP
jgi:hypothetical protein